MRYLYDREGRKTVEVSEFVIIGNNVVFGREVKVGPFSIIGDNTVIGDNVYIEPYTDIKPGSSIEVKTVKKKLKQDKTLATILNTTLCFLFFIFSVVSPVSAAIVSVCNMPSSASVQVRIYNITGATETVAWTATGVTERAVGLSKSCYYYNATITSGSSYEIDWRDAASPTKVASEVKSSFETYVDASVAAIPITPTLQAVWTNAKAGYLTGNVALDSTVAKDATVMKTASYTAPDNSSISAIKTKTDNLPSDPASNTQVATRSSQTSVNAIPTTPLLTSDARIPATLIASSVEVAKDSTVAKDATVAKAATVALDATVAKQATLTTLIPEAIPFTSHKIDANATATVDNAAIADAVWDELLAGHSTAGSSGLALATASASGDPWDVTAGTYGAGKFGKIVYDYLNAAVTSRPTLAQIEASTQLLMKTGGSTTNQVAVTADNKVNVNPVLSDSDKSDIASRVWNNTYASTRKLTSPSTDSTPVYDMSATTGVDSIADAVWDEAIAGHTASGSTGQYLISASSSGDPWTAIIPGSYASGTAGNLLGKFKFNNFNDLWCVTHGGR